MSATTPAEAAVLSPPPVKPTVLCWSQSQNALHIEPLEWMLAANRHAYAEDRRMDYVPLFIGDEGQCDAAAETMRQTLHRRERVRAQAREAVETARGKAQR